MRTLPTGSIRGGAGVTGHGPPGAGRVRALARVAAAIVLLLAVGGCAQDQVQGAGTGLRSPDQLPAGWSASSGSSSAVAESIETAVATVDDPSSVTVAVAVLDRVGGERVGSAAAAHPQYSASLVKLVVVLDLLDRRRAGEPVTEGDLDLVRRALGASDDAAMNVLWTRFDGPGAVQRVADRLGLAGTRPPADPTQWGETVTTAVDVALVLDHILGPLPAGDRDLVVSAIRAAPQLAADGFDQGFGLFDDGRPDTFAKQGWMCCLSERLQLHTAGTLDRQDRFVVVVLSDQPAPGGYGAARPVVDTAVSALRTALSPS